VPGRRQQSQASAAEQLHSRHAFSLWHCTGSGMQVIMRHHALLHTTKMQQHSILRRECNSVAAVLGGMEAHENFLIVAPSLGLHEC
jgi:hypothetical protein